MDNVLYITRLMEGIDKNSKTVEMVLGIVKNPEQKYNYAN